MRRNCLWEGDFSPPMRGQPLVSAKSLFFVPDPRLPLISPPTVFGDRVILLRTGVIRPVAANKARRQLFHLQHVL